MINAVWKDVHVSKTQTDPSVQAHLWFLCKAELWFFCSKFPFPSLSWQAWQQQSLWHPNEQLQLTNYTRGIWWKCKSHTALGKAVSLSEHLSAMPSHARASLQCSLQITLCLNPPLKTKYNFLYFLCLLLFLSTRPCCLSLINYLSNKLLHLIVLLI